MGHLSHDQKGNFEDLAKDATYTHTNDDNTTEERALSWTRKIVDMRFYGKPNNEHDHAADEDLQEILEATDTNGKKYVIMSDEPPKPKKKGKVIVQDA